MSTRSPDFRLPTLSDDRANLNNVLLARGFSLFHNCVLFADIGCLALSLPPQAPSKLRHILMIKNHEFVKGPYRDQEILCVLSDADITRIWDWLGISMHERLVYHPSTIKP